MFGSELQLAPLVFWELLLTGGSECDARPMGACGRLSSVPAAPARAWNPPDVSNNEITAELVEKWIASPASYFVSYRKMRVSC